MLSPSILLSYDKCMNGCDKEENELRVFFIDYTFSEVSNKNEKWVFPCILKLIANKFTILWEREFSKLDK